MDNSNTHDDQSLYQILNEIKNEIQILKNGNLASANPPINSNSQLFREILDDIQGLKNGNHISLKSPNNSEVIGVNLLQVLLTEIQTLKNRDLVASNSGPPTPRLDVYAQTGTSHFMEHASNVDNTIINRINEIKDSLPKETRESIDGLKRLVKKSSKKYNDIILMEGDFFNTQDAFEKNHIDFKIYMDFKRKTIKSFLYIIDSLRVDDFV